jgi:hypothetical protein
MILGDKPLIFEVVLSHKSSSITPLFFSMSRPAMEVRLQVGQHDIDASSPRKTSSRLGALLMAKVYSTIS